jgi:glucosylceramidase
MVLGTKRPDGKKVLIVENDGASSQTFNIQFKGLWVSPTIEAGAIETFIW